MKIRVLGSAAAEGWPALFCECPACRKARANGGKDLRKRTAYLIDDDTLVDIGPDVYCATLQYGLDSSKFERLLVTHSHTDHLTPRELLWRHSGFSVASKTLDVYGNQAVMDRILSDKEVSNFPDELKCAFHVVKPGDTFTTGDMKVTAILADHAAEPELPLNYIIERGGVTALIGNDSGWWCQESWDILAKFRIDIAFIECTYGIKWPDQSAKHQGANTSVRVRDELRRLGCLKDDAAVIVNHFSHNCQNLHADFEAFFNPLGIAVGYDGMVVSR